jgi:hypothetical protein
MASSLQVGPLFDAWTMKKEVDKKRGLWDKGRRSLTWKLKLRFFADYFRTP